ncbi:MAG: DUF4911 domain-containing protein [Desulfuromonadales bacterium]|nr:DUF4911 domain-containing protein [Desulfuromonadales bacterium]
MDHDPLIKRFFIVSRREIGYLRFTFEGYDGLVFMRTLRASDGLIEIAYPSRRQADAESLLTALDLEIGLTLAEHPPADEYDLI